MRKGWLAMFVLLGVLLGGCADNGRSYVHVTPHSEQTVQSSTGSRTVETYGQLLDELRSMVKSGMENVVIYANGMDRHTLEQNMAVASRYIREQDSIGAYALSGITYEVGTTKGKTAVAVAAEYRQSAVEIRRILEVENAREVGDAIGKALEDCRPNVVMLIANYTTFDAAQLVEDYARQNPDIVMEIPEVVDAIYGTGVSRVAAVTFTYENSRDTLRQMQSQVRPVFEASKLYVSGDGSDFQKYSQLYAFLMERFNYVVETSITPSYSLLRHGVGDSRAFATVYASMCRKADLECYVVTGARNGEPWTWNIVKDSAQYYHVDLLACSADGVYREMTDDEMSGYVWDYSAYPECQ